ncbi:MAG TPA: glycoside hydrolase family 15 protein [Chlamydiales bacterium]|nr:glycoside hydrolase family 15 protein [Chlamydiales bacterium]
MPRDIPLGNGNVLIAFDLRFCLREFHFPYVGQENHAGENFRLGIWIDDRFSWIDENWQIEMDYKEDSLVSNVLLKNDELGIGILSNDLVDFEENLYLKRMVIENFRNETRELKVFLTHDFHIYGNEIGDTAAFKPENNSLLHYKGERYFLINCFANHKFGIDLFSIGNAGTWKDAENGILNAHPIAQGSVDSVIGIPLTLLPYGKESFYYWIAVGKNWEEVESLNKRIEKKSPNEIFRRTFDYWKLWVNKEQVNFHGLSEKIIRLYRRSLLICRTQMNQCGSIIAANDSDSIHFNRDTYSYVWPRDGALIANALDAAGYDCSNFYRFCAKIVEKEGYFLHKYSPSGFLGSSWHPWLHDKKAQLPIQEDGTALVVWALWNHYQKFKDVDLIRTLYTSLIKKCADFMMNYRDVKTGLPLPSFDLWEERQGVFTFTASAVFAGLMAASHFANAFGEVSLAQEYEEGAQKVRNAMDEYLYLPKEKRFARMVHFSGDDIEMDPTIDASLCAIFAFDVYKIDDAKVKDTMSQVFETLSVAGGIIRYENDLYYKRENASSNPWFVTTLWKAQYEIRRGNIQNAIEILEWIAERALKSGCLAEQIDPDTLEPISVCPLTWSHGTFIDTVGQLLHETEQNHLDELF